MRLKVEVRRTFKSKSRVWGTEVYRSSAPALHKIKERFVFATRDSGNESFFYIYIRRVMEISPIERFFLTPGPLGILPIEAPGPMAKEPIGP